jgi:hypothetical protein
MKPRLVKVHGMWHCGVKGVKGPLGIGFNEEGAYLDWFCLVKREWILAWRGEC